MKPFLLLGLLALFLVPNASLACPYQVRTAYASPYVAPVVYQQAVQVVERLVPVEVYTPVFVPTFTVSYQGPVAGGTTVAPNPASQAPQAPSGELAAILAEVRRLGSRLDRMERGAPVRPKEAPAPFVPPPEKKPAPPREGEASGKTRGQILVKSCAACHTRNKLADEVPFALVEADGAEIPLTPLQELKLVKYVYRAKCPPKGNDFGIPPLTDEEFGILTLGKGEDK